MATEIGDILRSRAANMRRPLVVAVMMGGRSGEHAVSLASGRAVYDHLCDSRLPPGLFEPLPVVIDEQGGWHLPSPTGPACTMPWPPAEHQGVALPEGCRALLEHRPDVVFVAMHGPEGEDGKLQSLLELLGLCYTGSDSYASSLCMDKPVAKRILKSHGIAVPAEIILSRARWQEAQDQSLAELKARFEAPWVLKTPRLGSSVGLEIVRSEDRLAATLDELFVHDRTVLVEEFVAGRELTCGVLDGWAFGPARGLPLLEIIPLEDPYFNYHAKYTEGATREPCPAPVSDSVHQRGREMALIAHRALGCRGFSRTDFFWTPEDELLVLETNTIPGLTSTSLMPKMAAAVGISFAELVAGMVLSALPSGHPHS